MWLQFVRIPHKSIGCMLIVKAFRLARAGVCDFNFDHYGCSVVQQFVSQSVATLPTCGPPLILFPTSKRWGPLGGSGLGATWPTCGPHESAVGCWKVHNYTCISVYIIVCISGMSIHSYKRLLERQNWGAIGKCMHLRWV